MPARRSPTPAAARSAAAKPQDRPAANRRAKGKRAGRRAGDGDGKPGDGNGSAAAHLERLEREVGRTRELERMVAGLEVHQEEARGRNEQLLETQLALEHSLARFADLYDHAPIAYLTLDDNGVVLDANRTSMSLLHCRREALVRAPFLSFVSEGDRRAFLKHMRLCRLQADPAEGAEPATLTVELNVSARSGKLVPVLLSTRLAPREAGRGARFRMTLTDLAERKAAELQLTRFQQQLAAMAAESALAAERERRRIAVEVHDTLSQSLVLAKMKLAGLIKKAAEAGVRDDVARGIADVTHLIEEVLGQTRTLTFELSPPILYELGFEPALEWLAERVSQRHGLEVVVDRGKQQCGKLPEERAVVLFQLVRELLNNAVRHAGARRVIVRPRCRDGEVLISVQDDGKGFDPEAVTASVPLGGNRTRGGFGLFSVRTRLQHLGGELKIASAPGRPTTVSLSLPVAGGGEIFQVTKPIQQR